MTVPIFKIPSQTEDSLQNIVNEGRQTEKTLKPQTDFFKKVDAFVASGKFATEEEAFKETAKAALHFGDEYENIDLQAIIQPKQIETQEEIQEPEEDISGLDIGVKTGETIAKFGESLKPFTGETEEFADTGLLEGGAKFLANVPGWGVQTVGELLKVASNPVGTTKDIAEFAGTGVEKILNKITGQDFYTSDERRVISEGISNEIEKLGEPGRIREILIENPGEFLFAIKGGLKSSANLAKNKDFGKLAEGLEKASDIVDPVNVLKAESKLVTAPIKKAAEIGGNVYTKVTGINPESVKAIVKNPELFKQAETGTLTRSSLGESTVKAIDSRIDDLSELGKEYGNLRKGNVVSNSTELNTKLTNITDNIDVKELTNLDRKVLAEATGYTSRYTGDITDSNLLALRKQIDSILYDPTTGVKRKLSPNGERIIGNIRRDVDEIAKTNIPGLRELDAKFAPEIQELNKLKSIIYDSKGNIKDNYIQQISNLTGKGKELKLDRVKKIIPDIEDKINALKALEDVELAKGIKVGTYGQAAVAGVGLASGVIPAIATFILTHPSTLVNILKGYTKSKEIINSISQKVKNGIRLSTEEAKVVGLAIKDQALEKGAKIADDIADKVGVRSKFIDDTGKSLDDFGESALIQEAKKYKSGKDMYDRMPTLERNMFDNEGIYSLKHFEDFYKKNILAKTTGKTVYRGQSKSGDNIQYNDTNFQGNTDGGVFFTPEKSTAKKYGQNIIELKSNKYNTVNNAELKKLQEMAVKQVTKDIKNGIESKELIEQMALGRPKAFAEYTGKPFIETGDMFGEVGELIYYKDLVK